MVRSDCTTKCFQSNEEAPSAQTSTATGACLRLKQVVTSLRHTFLAQDLASVCQRHTPAEMCRAPECGDGSLCLSFLLSNEPATARATQPTAASRQEEELHETAESRPQQ